MNSTWLILAKGVEGNSTLTSLPNVSVFSKKPSVGHQYVFLHGISCVLHDTGNQKVHRFSLCQEEIKNEQSTNIWLGVHISTKTVFWVGEELSVTYPLFFTRWHFHVILF